MIWIFLTLLVLAYVLVFCLMRIAAISDRRSEAMFSDDEPRIIVRRVVYDWQARGDFDD